MGVLDVPYCPNPKCPQEKVQKDITNCPQCGAKIQRFGVRQAVDLIKEKRHPQGNGKDDQLSSEDSQGIEEGELSLSGSSRKQVKTSKFLVTPEMTDQEIVQKIIEDMQNLARHEGGTGWMQLDSILSGSRSDQILISGFKALIDENKIIIRQNELMLRALRKLLETHGENETAK
jgi:hypothetical protein